MNLISKLDHYIIPNDIVVMLSKIYRYIGNNEFYINSLGNDLNKVIDTTVNKDAFYLSKILKLDVSEARTKLIIEKNSLPRTKEEETLYNLKEVLTAIQQKYHLMSLQSNEILNMLNYIYSHYNSIKFDLSDVTTLNIFNNKEKSKRTILDEMNDLVNVYLRSEKFDKIILYLNYFVDFYNLRPFISKNEVISLVILYELILVSDINAFKYISFFELLYNNFDRFSDELSKASVNWRDGFSQTAEFVRFFLQLVIESYSKTDMIIKTYKFDQNNKKSENIENIILNMKTTFTKEDIRLQNPYVSESTINRALISLRDSGYIEPLGKGRSAKWIRKR
ncbi:MAG: hypothetical protein J5666_07435 [Bacilli bacterium]|nr:hypothetical protein [Bacilli bacterium]